LGWSKTNGIPSTPSQKSIDVWRSAPTIVMWWTPWDWSLRTSTVLLACGPRAKRYPAQHMSDDPFGTYAASAGARARARVSTTTLFGQVMFLVGIALAFLAVGAIVGKDIEYSTARILGFVAFGMVLAQSFVAPLRVGALGLTWLFGFALVLGLSLGPILNFYANTDPDTVYQAAGGTALITLGMGAYGTATSKDLSRWIRPLSWALLGVIAISLVAWLFGTGGSPIISLAVLALSAAILIVDFNYLRRQATEDDVIWLATGIFVSIVNIFLSLLNILGGRN
jgi:modulator of FtsH protease